MWINRQTYEHLVFDGVKRNEEARVLDAQNRVLQVNLDWLRVRVNQLEHERAQLLFNYTGVKVAVPEIQRAPETLVHPLNKLPSFADVGEAEAVRLGIEWDSEGHVVYKDK